MNVEDLRYLILNTTEPLLLKNILNWKMLNWQLNYWESLLKDEELEFRCGLNVYTKEPQWERTTSVEKINFQTFLSRINLQENNEWMYFDYKYLKDCLLIEKLRNDISWKSFGFPELKPEDGTIWIGSKGAHTPCHMDTYGCNLVAQVYGTKQWLIFPPEEDLKPTRVPYEESSIYSKLNFFSPVVEEFTDICNCRKIILQPGDVLILPHKWWHYVENLDLSISINVWLPHPQDDKERLSESIVQLLINQLLKDINVDGRNRILNPNSHELNMDECLKYINISKDICINKKIDEAQKYVDSSTFKDMLNNNIQVIPRMSNNDFQIFLEQQSDRFDDRIISKYDNNYSNVEEIVNLVNAFTHPDVINLIKTKLLG